MAEFDFEKYLKETVDEVRVKPFKERWPALKQRIEQNDAKPLDGVPNFSENKDNKKL